MTTIEISLSRAHKIGERLKTRGTELFNEAFGMAKASQIAGTSGEQQIARLAEKAARAMQLHAESERHMRAAAAVRAAISRENSARGIDKLLCELDAVNRLLVQTRSLHAEATNKSALPLPELRDFKSLFTEASYGNTGVDVQVLSEEHAQVLSEQLNRLQRESFDLTDRMAELNGPRVAIEVEDDLAAAVMGRLR